MVFLVAISAITFLPYAFQLTYYLDDWYYIYDGVVAGPNIFHSMFRVDRPIRGYLFDVLFSAFGPHPLPYHLGAYMWRLFAGIASYWLLNIIWPKEKRFNILIALLFTIYPGYAWWVSGIEYQPMSTGLFLQVFSILLTLISIQSDHQILKLAYAGISILTGWAYMALVDYAIGAEILRFLCIYLYVINRESVDVPYLTRLKPTIKFSLPYILPALGYMIWRIFIFDSERRATDIGLQFTAFKNSPDKYTLRAFSKFYSSFINVEVNAWFRQFQLQFTALGSKMPLSSLVITFAVILLMGILGYTWYRQGFFNDRNRSNSTAYELFALGFISLCFGLLPVILVGRFVNLGIYSHYGLPVSLAAVLILSGLIFLIPSRITQYILFVVFIGVAAASQSLIAEKTLILTRSFDTFWWQASWRIPDILPDTTFLTVYPYGNVVDNDLGLPQAVNLMYFSDPRDDDPVRYFVSTIMPSDKNITSVLTGEGKRIKKYRSHERLIDFGNITVITQPSPSSCVRIVDGSNYIFSEKDTQSLRSVFGYSRIENIRPAETGIIPPSYAFGYEPVHEWCFYFEKADLAVQKSSWSDAAKLGDEVIRLGFAPQDQVEWFPFLQAYAMMGDPEKVEFILKQVKSDRLFNDQICKLMYRNDTKFLPPSDMSDLIKEYSCQ